MEDFNLDDVVSYIKGNKNTFSRNLYSLWKHFPSQDLRPEDSVKAHIQFQEMVHSDLIKISPHSKYALVDFGAEFDPKEFNKETGSYITKKHPIVELQDWENLDEFDPQTGELGKQLEIVHKLSKAIQNVPTMMTVFLPTMIARKLVKDDKIIEQFKEDKNLVKDRLQVITKVMTEFAKICIESGSTGLFIATQETTSHDGWNPVIWSELALPYDKKIVDNLRTKAEFQVLHLHGDDIFFKEVLRKLHVDAINFHSFPDFPQFFSSKTIKNIFHGGLLGGLEEKYFLNSSSIDESEGNTLNELISSMDPILDRIIIAPNCVLPQTLSGEQLVNIVNKLRV